MTTNILVVAKRDSEHTFEDDKIQFVKLSTRSQTMLDKNTRVDDCLLDKGRKDTSIASDRYKHRDWQSSVDRGFEGSHARE